MAMAKCPGQDSRFWKPDDVGEVRCPHCQKPVEVWKDDVWRNCPHCGRRFMNPAMDLACAEWCQYAEKCLGPEFMEKLKERFDELTREKLEKEKKDA